MRDKPFLAIEWGLAWLGLINLDGVPIKFRLSEEHRGLLEVHDGEVEFLVVLAQAGATADDLLKLGHRIDVLVQHPAN